MVAPAKLEHVQLGPGLVLEHVAVGGGEVGPTRAAKRRANRTNSNLIAVGHAAAGAAAQGDLDRARHGGAQQPANVALDAKTPEGKAIGGLM